ncbi:hypothetical protein MRB53_038444 [Persea americana]|nr:hypothetical protein MRB53_038444 [Persea americana]
MRLWNALASYFASQTVLEDHDAVDIEHDIKEQDHSPLYFLQAPWGADPLARFGGFEHLELDWHRTFASSLVPGATTTWTTTTAEPEAGDNASISLSLTYPEINTDPTLSEVAYGWAASQWQAWARGTLVLTGSRCTTVTLDTPGILEFYVDGEHYFGGDFYGFRRAPVVVKLCPGHHRLDVRLLRDVRATGGLGAPSVEVALYAAVAEGLQVIPGSVLFPSVARGKFVSRYASVSVVNTEEYAIEVIRSSLRPGQTRSIPIDITSKLANCSRTILQLLYHAVGSRWHDLTTVDHELHRVDGLEAQKITFRHPSGTISYAMLRPPYSDVSANISSVPVFLNLHGAGLEADTAQLLQSLRGIDLAAWTLFPTGVTPWSGDDWHLCGWADVEAAIAAIPQWILDNDWKGPSADLQRWLVVGHSNGGQGAWYALTHRPDDVMAAAPVSGYLAIQTYVPYHFWRESEPFRMAVVQAALNSWRHELLVENSHGIPIQQQHGGNDDNVPPYNSRRMLQLITESGGQTTYNEVSGAGHWFDGILTTPPLVEFYNAQLEHHSKVRHRDHNFSLVVANPAEHGPKNGVSIVQLLVPGRLGRVDVLSVNRRVMLRTSNVRRLHLSEADLSGMSSVTVDAQELSLGPRSGDTGYALVKTNNGSWDWSPQSDDHTSERVGRQQGNINSILQTQGPFTIQHYGDPLAHLAVQTARNLQQYFRADANIVSSNNTDILASPTGNLITFAVGDSLPSARFEDFPITVSGDGLALREASGVTTRFTKSAKGLGAIFLRPMPDQRLELVIWGIDPVSAAVAARLAPTLTGVGQPDLVVTTGRHALEGSGRGTCFGLLRLAVECDCDVVRRLRSELHVRSALYRLQGRFSGDDFGIVRLLPFVLRHVPRDAVALPPALRLNGVAIIKKLCQALCLACIGSTNQFGIPNTHPPLHSISRHFSCLLARLLQSNKVQGVIVCPSINVTRLCFPLLSTPSNSSCPNTTRVNFANPTRRPTSLPSGNIPTSILPPRTSSISCTLSLATHLLSRPLCFLPYFSRHLVRPALSSPLQRRWTEIPIASGNILCLIPSATMSAATLSGSPHRKKQSAQFAIYKDTDYPDISKLSIANSGPVCRALPVPS